MKCMEARSSVTRLSQRDPWLCVPQLLVVCLFQKRSAIRLNVILANSHFLVKKKFWIFQAEQTVAAVFMRTTRKLFKSKREKEPEVFHKVFKRPRDYSREIFFNTDEIKFPVEFSPRNRYDLYSAFFYRLKCRPF